MKKQDPKYFKNHKAKLTALGLCREGCGRPVVAGRTRCKEHLEYNSKRMVRERRKRREQGLCISCGRKNDDPSYSKCTTCTDECEDYNRIRRSL